MIYSPYRSHASQTPTTQGEIGDERAQPHLETEPFPRSGYHVATRAHTTHDYDFHRIEQALRNLTRGQR